LLSPPQHLTTSSSIVRQTLYLAEWETIIEPLVTPYALYLLGEIRKYG
jgi:hypothetical protein